MVLHLDILSFGEVLPVLRRPGVVMDPMDLRLLATDIIPSSALLPTVLATFLLRRTTTPTPLITGMDRRRLRQRDRPMVMLPRMLPRHLLLPTLSLSTRQMVPAKVVEVPVI